MKRSFAAFLIALAASFGTAPGYAQDATAPSGTALNEILTAQIPEAKLKLAAKLIDLTGTARLFDELLPNIADTAKNNFIRANPQMQLGIINIVDKVAIGLVSRRPELDEYLARVWASGFSEEELQGLIEFYGTDLGKKYSVALPQLLAVQTAAAQEWAKSVSQELNDRVQAELRAAVQAESQALQSDVAGPAAETPAQ